MNPFELPPPQGRSFLRRAIAACAAIVLLSAGAAYAAVVLLVDESRGILGSGDYDIAVDYDGPARTLMLLGTDGRYDERELGIKPRSDTVLLVRLDPAEDAISMLSLPRDLRVGPGARLNEAYELGGAKATIKTVQRVLPGVKVDHVIEVSFGRFQRALNRVGCVYLDIDNRYYSDGTGGYATIDLQPGYQKLCGQDALDYVRYRHTDNDIVRGGRQQDFLRQLKVQPGVTRLLDFGNRNETARLFATYADYDKGLTDRKEFFELLKLAIKSAGKPVREVRLPVQDAGSFVVSTPEQLRRTVDEFLHGSQHKPRKRRAGAKRPHRPAAVAGLEEAEREGEDQALVPSTKLGFPVLFPKLRTARGVYLGDTARVYRIGRYEAYRMTIRKGPNGEYFGVQGLTWKDPPILAGPKETIRRGGRTLDLYYDGKRLRLVALRTDKAVYWVTNTLTRSIDNQRLIAIAASLQRIGG